MIRSSLRLLLIAPASLKNSLNTWYHNNINVGGGNNFDVPLNATGVLADGITYYWVATVLTLPEAARVIKKLCQMASVTIPDWENMTLQQRKDWVLSTKASIESATGIFIYLDDIDDPWKDPNEALAERNLKIIVTNP